MVSLAWACYNTIPPLLLLHYAWVQNRFLRATITFSTIWGTLMLLVVIVAIWLLLPNTYDFGSVRSAGNKPLCVCCPTAAPVQDTANHTCVLVCALGHPDAAGGTPSHVAAAAAEHL